MDETGNQTVVFGRRGSRPFTSSEMQKFYRHDDSLYTVEDTVLREGKLETKAGRALKPTKEFQAQEPREKTAPGSRSERLVRRGE